MSMFLCLVHRDCAPISDEVCRRYEAKRESRTHRPARWCVHGEFAALIGSDVPGLEPSIVRVHDWIGVGTVRLDNREYTNRFGIAGNPSDLAVLLRAVHDRGSHTLPHVIGDFSFVAWNRVTRQLIAARDSFGVRRLYMSRAGDLIAFSTRASLLTERGEYDLEFFAEYLVNGYGGEGRTTFADVEAIRPAEVISYTDGTISRNRYWSPLAADWVAGEWEPAIIDEFRERLFDAVRCRLTGETNVWSHLSGGMDSSSIVAVSQTLEQRGAVPHGVAGVITYVTTPATGGDPEHAALVCQHFGLRQALLSDWWMWQDDDRGVPHLDQPNTAQSTYAIDRRLTALVHAAGGTILLCGIGADIYLRPQLDAAADMIASGQLRRAVQNLASWAGTARESFWRLAFRHALYPMLPTGMRQAFARRAWRVPSWIDPYFAHRLDVRSRTRARRLYEGPARAKARTSQGNRLLTQEMAMPQERIGEPNLEWRYPYLHRPLVEYALRMPPEWHALPGTSKRLLREAMAGVLPEPVRLRRGKGGLRPQITKALSLESERLNRIVRESVLGELGCIDVERLLHLVNACGDHHAEEIAPVVNTLSLELWLRRRSEGWS